MDALPGARGSGEVGGDDVGGVAVEGAAGAVVAAGLAWVGVPREVLDVPEAAAGVERGNRPVLHDSAGGVPRPLHGEAVLHGHTVDLHDDATSSWVSWTAGECRVATASWDQHFWNRLGDASAEPPGVWGLPNRGDEVPGGQHQGRISSLYGSATSEPFALER
jgi:hypothetical protein